VWAVTTLDGSQCDERRRPRRRVRRLRYGARHPVAIAAVLSSQFAAITALVGVVALRERPAPRQLFGLVAIGAGVTALALVH
jgi:hypothetical protein